MPSLPIALGGISTTSEEVAGPYQHQLYEYYHDGDGTDDAGDGGATAANDVDGGAAGKLASSRSSSSASISLQPVDLFQTLAFGLCPEKEWQARVVLSFYDVMKCYSRPNGDETVENRNDDSMGKSFNQDTTATTTTTTKCSQSSRRRLRSMVEVRIRISRVCHPSLASTYRETVYHLKLQEGDKATAAGGYGNAARQNQQQPQVVFSEDRKNLCILIFHPHNVSSSSVVICQLRRPRMDVVRTKNLDSPKNLAKTMMPAELPTPPSYILDIENSNSDITNANSSGIGNGAIINSDNTTAATAAATKTLRTKLVARSHNLGETPAIATNPRFVTAGIWGEVTSLCPIPITQLGTRPTFLLVCEDSTLVWVDYRSGHAVARGKVPWPKQSQQQQQPKIRSIQASPDATLSKGSLILVTSPTSQSDKQCGRCVLLHYKLESTTPMQQSFLKRASTGTVSLVPKISHSQSLDDLDFESSQHSSARSGFEKRSGRRTIDRVAPRRTVSTGTVPKFQRSLHRHVNNLLASPTQAIQSQTTKLQERIRNHQEQQRKRAMDGEHKNQNVKGSNSFSTLHQNVLGEMLLSTVKKASDFSSEASKLNEKSPHRGVHQRNEQRKRRQVPSRSQSQLSSSSSLLEGISNALEGIQKMTGSDNRDFGEQRKEDMKLYVLRELQARPKTRSIVEDEQAMERLVCATTMNNSGAGDLASYSPSLNALIERYSGTDFCQNSSPSQRKSSQWRSSPRNNGGMKMIEVEIMSTWEDEHGRDKNSDQQSVVAASFGSVPSVVCFLLQSGKTTRSQRIAQVCTVNESGLFVPAVPMTLSLDQVEQSISSNCNDFSLQAQEPWEGVDDVQSHVGLEYDLMSECFIVSTFYGNKKHWVGCLWNWRSNSLGLILREKYFPTSWKSLWMVRDRDKGWNVVHLKSSFQSFEPKMERIEMHTTVVAAGFLSPSSFNSGGSTLSEASSLLLSKDFVAIPCTKKKLSDPSSFDLAWNVSSLPPAYVAAFGAPTIAAVGSTKYQSVAVASTHGVCIIDAHRPSSRRWKQFGSPCEEKTFSVIAMAWWEGCRASDRDIEAEDLLVAVIKHKNGRQFLSCWSPKRLDLLNQLLESSDPTWKPYESQDFAPCWGVELPNDLNATHLSLLAESRIGMATQSDRPRRAVALIHALDDDRLEFDYICFRLQVVRLTKPANKSSDQNTSHRSYLVFAQEMRQGRLINGARSVGPIHSIFLAGVSFCFDLRQPTVKKKDGTTNIGDDLVASLGVIRYGGMEYVCLTRTGNGWMEKITDHEISRLWLSDIVHSQENSVAFATFVWAFELLNGDIYCWSLPSLLKANLNGLEDWPSMNMFKEATIKRPRGLRLPSVVCRKPSRAWYKRWLAGTLCEIGSASDWMQHSSSGSKFHIELGTVPRSQFGCTLRAGQESKRLESDVNAVSALFSRNNRSTDVYCQSSFLMTPPAFVLSVNVLLLEAASLRMEVSISKDPKMAATNSVLNVEAMRLRDIDRHVHERLSAARNKDSVMMASRLLILRSIEIVATASKAHSISPSEVTESNLLLSTTYFAGTVDVVRHSTTNLQYASLFLQVGRQVEPSHLEYLFPLPLPPKSSSSGANYSKFKQLRNSRMLDKSNARTVSDLVTICVEERSLAAAASALPLFSTKTQALNYSQMLLDEAIDSFVKNTMSHECDFDSTGEERQVIGDIFRFAIKLEDSEVANGAVQGHNGHGRSDDGAGTNSYDHSNSTVSICEVSEPENAQTRALICGSGTFLKYMVPSNIVRESEKAKQEEAIKKEASAFIKHSLDDPVIGFATLPDWDDASKDIAFSAISSTACLVGEAIVDLLQSTQTDRNWCAMAGLAEMLIVQDASAVAVPRTTKIPPLGRFQKVVEQANSLDMLSIVPETFDLNNGSESCLTHYLEAEILKVREQLAAEVSTPSSMISVENIFDLALMMMNRVDGLTLQDVSDQSLLELGLVVIIIVAGHLCGHSAAILETLDSGCLIAKSYSSALARIMN